VEELKLNQTINPLADLISDEVYDLLLSKRLIDQKSVRDYTIRKKFKDYRAQKLSAGNSIEAVRKEFPYLEFDTIRKIVYNTTN